MNGLKPSRAGYMNISELYIYPIKSCKGFNVPTVHLDPYGIVGDRRMMIVDTEGVVFTQRDYHNLCFVEPAIDENNLSLRAPGMSELIFPSSSFEDQPVRVKVWEDTFMALDCGKVTSEWFSDYLHTSCKLVRMGQPFIRPIDSNYTKRDEHVSFADGFPILLISKGSLNDLNQRLPDPIAMVRFRPNMVVEGCEPFAEDTWKKITAAGQEFEIVKPCARCVVTTIDPLTGENGDEPLRTLATYRKTPQGKVLFGQNVIHLQKTGSLKVGDKLSVLI